MTPIVLFFQSTTDKSWRDKLEGVYRYAKSVGWQIHVIEADSSPTTIRQALKLWNPIGCMVDRAMSLGRNPVALFRGHPTVYLDQNPKTATPDISTVTNDSAACARMAAEEFLRTDVKNFTYIPFGERVFWCEERQAAFSAAIQKAGRNYIPWPGSLTKLPIPCGILCAEDPVARRAMDDAARFQLRIPEDLMFIGIDNDPLICESAHPTLTSVLPGFENAGYCLAELLANRITHPRSRPQHLTYAPVTLVRRESSRRFLREDHRVKTALAYIRAHATDPKLRTKDIATAMGCSRSLADLRFRQCTGHSIHAEINTVRLEMAFMLLRNPDQMISPVANLCGYASEPFFKRLFKSTTGMTMRDWQRANSTHYGNDHNKENKTHK